MKISDTHIKRPTATDVARKAGVSRTQVSYVLNNQNLDHVSSENQQKILKAAADLGYQPHSSAQTLRRGYSTEFSIFFPAPYSPRINSIIGTIHESGLEHGFSPIQYSFNSYKHENRMYEALHAMLSKKPFGVFCSLIDLKEKDLKYMLEHGVKKLLILDIQQHAEYTTLYLPIKEVGMVLAAFTEKQGYSSIAFLQPSDPIQQRSFQYRLDGFNLVWDPANTLDRTIIHWAVDEYRPTLKQARLFVKDLLQRPKLPELLYTFSDDYAIPILAALQEQNIQVPRDIAILGTDNLFYSELMCPKLSTISMDSHNLGQRAVALMNHLITETPLDPRFSQPAYPRLIERETT